MEYFLKGIKYIDLDLEKRRFRLSDSLDSYSKEDPLHLSKFIRDGNWIELRDFTKLFFYEKQKKAIDFFNKIINDINYENTYKKISLKKIKCLQKKYLLLDKNFDFEFNYDGNKKIIISLSWDILLHREKNKKSFSSFLLNKENFLSIKGMDPKIFFFFTIKNFQNIELFINSLLHLLKIKKDFWLYKTDFSLILCIKTNIKKQNKLISLLETSNSFIATFCKSFYNKSFYTQINKMLIWDKFIEFVNLNEMKLLFDFNKDKKQHNGMIKEIFNKYKTSKNFITSINIEPNYDILIKKENNFDIQLLTPKINTLFLKNMITNSKIAKEMIFNIFYHRIMINSQINKNYFYFLNSSYIKNYWMLVKNNSSTLIPLLAIKRWEIAKLEIVLNLLIKENIKFGIYVDDVISSQIITLLTKYEPEYCVLDYSDTKFNSSDKLINYSTANKVIYKVKTNILTKG